MSKSLSQQGAFAALRRVLYKFLLALGLGQDGPAGQLPEDMITRQV
ncbi:MAG: hypothetical protein WC474_10245 [Hydrogenophilaceae bacterium]